MTSFLYFFGKTLNAFGQNFIFFSEIFKSSHFVISIASANKRSFLRLLIVIYSSKKIEDFSLRDEELWLEVEFSRL